MKLLSTVTAQKSPLRRAAIAAPLNEELDVLPDSREFAHKHSGEAECDAHD
jgi:hypothetical protein